MRDILPYRAGSVTEEAWCKCSSCRRDVRLDIGRAYARLECGWVKSRHFRSKNGRAPCLVSFEAVCSKVCLMRRRPKRSVYALETEPLSRFVGPGSIDAFHSVAETYGLTPRLRYWLPRFLEALALPKRQVLRKTSSPDDGVNEIPDAFRRYPEASGLTRTIYRKTGPWNVSAGK